MDLIDFSLHVEFVAGFINTPISDSYTLLNLSRHIVYEKGFVLAVTTIVCDRSPPIIVALLVGFSH